MKYNHVNDKKTIESIFLKLLKERNEALKEKKCPGCLNKIKEEDFKDKLSKKEFGMSGLCQKCQDRVFRK